MLLHDMITVRSVHHAVAGASPLAYFSEERSLREWFHVDMYITMEPNSWSRRFMKTEVVSAAPFLCCGQQRPCIMYASNQSSPTEAQLAAYALLHASDASKLLHFAHIVSVSSQSSTFVSHCNKCFGIQEPKNCPCIKLSSLRGATAVRMR